MQGLHAGQTPFVLCLFLVSGCVLFLSCVLYLLRPTILNCCSENNLLHLEPNYSADNTMSPKFVMWLKLHV